MTKLILRRVQRKIRVAIVTRTANEVPERTLLWEEIVLGSGSEERSCLEDMWGMAIAGWLVGCCGSSVSISCGVPVI